MVGDPPESDGGHPTLSVSLSLLFIFRASYKSPTRVGERSATTVRAGVLGFLFSDLLAK